MTVDEPSEIQDGGVSPAEGSGADRPPTEELVDLSAEEVPPEGRESPVAVAPYDPAEDRERVRGRIAQTLVWLLVSIAGLSLIVGAWLALRTENGIEALKIVLELILTPIVGLVGAVTGFYFGEKSGRRSG